MPSRRSIKYTNVIRRILFELNSKIIYYDKIWTSLNWKQFSKHIIALGKNRECHTSVCRKQMIGRKVRNTAQTAFSKRQNEWKSIS